MAINTQKFLDEWLGQIDWDEKLHIPSEAMVDFKVDTFKRTPKQSYVVELRPSDRRPRGCRHIKPESIKFVNAHVKHVAPVHTHYVHPKTGELEVDITIGFSDKSCYNSNVSDDLYEAFCEAHQRKAFDAMGVKSELLGFGQERK